MTSAEKCRTMGWEPGDVLRGDEGYGPVYIVITGIGRTDVFAVPLSDYEQGYRDCCWTLEFRDWRQVGSNGRLWRGPE